MSEAVVLQAQPREVIGKQVKQLRAVGQIPGVIYGPSQNPVHIMMDWPQLRAVLIRAGGTNLVDVKVQDQTYTTLIRVVDRHPVRRDVLHVDFYAVNLNETIISNIPIELINVESTQLRLRGQVVQEAPTIEVESLPSDIPSKVIVDVSVLKAIGDMIHVSDLPALEKVTYASDPHMVVVRSVYEGVDTEAEEVTTTDSGPAEPERITRKKEDFEEE
ncbi:MAG: 50S ribosomal protein L25 [Chloroflexota bacterium]|nr:50S ribosomal protein L25 [Chloroflexota bacterium]NOG65503.1 50S ribosomal protein L25 [Chloroflexota bacterium]GIK65345.1 MAG: 50S ribosomal protein L25 [Chloroflexota bacterium]